VQTTSLTKGERMVGKKERCLEKGGSPKEIKG
jgi:hypothetical protein